MNTLSPSLALPPDPALLLAWYDRHRRRMPWRAEQGMMPNAYHVWLSEIMCQQTTVATVIPYFLRFIGHFPNVHALADAPLDDVLKLWSGLGYYARARNLHRCAQMVAHDYDGVFPDDEDELLKLPGVGFYTAAALAAIVYGKRTSPVDGNLERVMARLFAVEQPLPAAKPVLRQLALDLTPADRPGDFAQALMDLGATVCTPRKAHCPICPWTSRCAAFARGDMETFPRKTPKPVKIPRFGTAFLVYRADGALLLRSRADTGLLGGMTEVPSTPWSEEERSPTHALSYAPVSAQWQMHTGKVKHVFSHFPLFLDVWSTHIAQHTAAPEGFWWSPSEQITTEALPTVMRKIIDHGLKHPPLSEGMLSPSVSAPFDFLPPGTSQSRKKSA